MTANRDTVEHAITESLNGQQLGEKSIHCELQEMRHADPAHYLENIRLMEKMTANYKDFPHLELHNAEQAAERHAAHQGHQRPSHEEHRRHQSENGESYEPHIQTAPVIPVTREELPPLPPSREYLERIADSPTMASTTPGAGRILAERNVWPPVPHDGY